MKRVSIRFCGGCNPRYDRAETARKIKESFEDFTFVKGSDEHDVRINLCGCPARCINEEKETSLTVFNLTGWKEIEKFMKKMK